MQRSIFKIIKCLFFPTRILLVVSKVYLCTTLVLLSSSLSAQVKEDTALKVGTDSLSRETQRWIESSARIESLLKENAAYLQAWKDDHAMPDSRLLDEVDGLLKFYDSQERTIPAMDSLLQIFDAKYHLYAQEAQQQRKKMEQHHLFYYAVSIGGGGLFLFQKSGIPFNFDYSHYNNGGNRDFNFHTIGRFPKKYTGFSASGAFSLFIVKNIFFEFGFMHAVTHVSTVSYISCLIPSSYSTFQVYPDDYNISTSSIDLTGNIFFKITPQLKLCFGLGITYLQSSSPDYVYEYNTKMNGLFVDVSSVSSDSWEMLARVGLEFPLKNVITMQILCDGRIAVSSSEDVSPISLQPLFRLV